MPTTHARFVAGLVAVGLGVAALSACGSSEADSSGSDAADQKNEWGLEPVDTVVALLPDDAKGSTLSNAVYNDYPPEMFLKDGKLAGIQVDLANAAAAVMGVKLENKAVGSFDSIIPGIVGKRYDLASSDFGVTDERIAQVDFVTVFDLGTSFAVKSGSDTGIDQRGDLCGLSVGVIAGSYFVPQVKDISKECVADGAPAVDLQTFPQQSAAVLAVANGRVDAIGASADVIAYTADQEAANVELTGLVVDPIPQAVAFPKGSELTEAWQAAVQELITNGVYAEIMDEWGVGDIAFTDPEHVKINETKAAS